MEKNYNKLEIYKQAEKKVKAIRGFYINLFIYLITNAIFVYINLTYSPESYWAWYTLLFWGAGMAVYGIMVFRYKPVKNRKPIGATEESEVSLHEQLQYNRLQNRVRALKNFYRHLTAYVIVCVVLAILYLVAFKTGREFLTFLVYGTAVGWTIGLVVHIFIVFVAPKFMGKSWEERKIREFIVQDKELQQMYQSQK